MSCDHKNTPHYPPGPVVVQWGYPRSDPPELARIVPCPDCGAPIDRGHYPLHLIHPEWLRDKGYKVPDKLPHFGLSKSKLGP